MSIKEFTTAQKSHDSEEAERPKSITIKVDGRELTFQGPESKTFLMLMSIYAELETGNSMQALGSTINLVFNLAEGDDRNYLRRRLFDVNDKFGQDEISDIFRYLVAEWSGRPTEEPSGSDSPSPTDTGVSSTESSQPAALIPSTFGPTGS